MALFVFGNGLRIATPDSMDAATYPDFREIVAFEIFEEQIFGRVGSDFESHVFPVFVNEGNPFEKMGILVRMGGIFVPDTYDDAVVRLSESGDVLSFFFGKIVVIERFVHVFPHRMEKFLRSSARRAGEGIRDGFERGSGSDFQLFLPECGAVEVGTLRTSEFFHVFFRTLRIADFRQNTRFAPGRAVDFRSFRV